MNHPRMRRLVYAVSLLLPWALRRLLLVRGLGFKLHPTSRIGLSWIVPRRLEMGAHARIGHGSVCKSIELLSLGEHATLGNGNWISGFPLARHPREGEHFAHESERCPELVIGAHAAITHRHILDCTASIHIGPLATLAGYGSQLLTHSIDLDECRQTSAPIRIGRACFVGTDAVILGGAVLPDFCALGAKSLLNKAHAQTHFLYGGVPARPLRALDPGTKYFHRTSGFVM